MSNAKEDQRDVVVKKPRVRLRRVLFFVAVLVVIIVVAGAAVLWERQTRTDRVMQKFLDGPNDSQLRNEEGEIRGSFDKTKIDGVRKVTYRFRGAEPSEGMSYHGWLSDASRSDIRYAGEFYPFDRDEWALVFTTEAGMERYEHVLVSLEAEQYPQYPSSIIFGGSFEDI